MSEIEKLRNKMGYLESLANYLMLQLAAKDVKPIIDPNQTFDTDTLSLARDTIINYLESTVEDENGPPKKSIEP